MTGWWNACAPREQLLILIAGALMSAALIVQAVLVPSLHAREMAGNALALGHSTLVRLDRLRDAGAVYVEVRVSGTPADARPAAELLASELGLSLKPSAPGSANLRFAFAAAPATSVFSWIERVEAELGLTVQSAELTGVELGQVEAVVELAGGAAR